MAAEVRTERRARPRLPPTRVWIPYIQAPNVTKPPAILNEGGRRSLWSELLVQSRHARCLYRRARTSTRE